MYRAVGYSCGMEPLVLRRARAHTGVVDKGIVVLGRVNMSSGLDVSGETPVHNAARQLAGTKL